MWVHFIGDVEVEVGVAWLHDMEMQGVCLPSLVQVQRLFRTFLDPYPVPPISLISCVDVRNTVRIRGCIEITLPYLTLPQPVYISGNRNTFSYHLCITLTIDH